MDSAGDAIQTANWGQSITGSSGQICPLKAKATMGGGWTHYINRRKAREVTLGQCRSIEQILRKIKRYEQKLGIESIVDKYDLKNVEK